MKTIRTFLFLGALLASGSALADPFSVESGGRAYTPYLTLTAPSGTSALVLQDGAKICLRPDCGGRVEITGGRVTLGGLNAGVLNLYNTGVFSTTGTSDLQGAVANSTASNGGSLAINDPIRNLSTTTALFESSTAVTGGVDVGFTRNTLNTLDAGDVLAQDKNNGVSVYSLYASGTLALSGNVNVIGGTVYTPSSGATIKGNAPDSGSAVGVIIDNAASLTTTGAKILSVRNFNSEKASIDKDGTAVFNSLSTSGNLIVGWTMTMNVATTPGTCGASAEGRIIRVTGTGGTATAKRTQLCLCTSDGAATPVYAWQNMAGGALGTSTACTP